MLLERSASSTYSLALPVSKNLVSPAYVNGKMTTFQGDIDAISKRLDDPEQNTTVLAPLNSALQKLPRKPWENPKDYDEMGAEAYEEQSGEDRATSNLRHFVEAHSIPVSPWKEGEKTNSLRGEKVWWEEKDGKRMVREFCLYKICSQTLTCNRSNPGTSRWRAPQIRCLMVRFGY